MRIAQLARHASVLVNGDGQAGFGPGGCLVSTPLHVMTLTFLIIRWRFLKMRVPQISMVYLSPSQEVLFLEALKCCAGEFENKTQQTPTVNPWKRWTHTPPNSLQSFCTVHITPARARFAQTVVTNLKKLLLGPELENARNGPRGIPHIQIPKSSQLTNLQC